ncbi:MAG: MBOAT family protein [Bacteroidaceae bacterium]|nr:MBOAT family protein [Bacteroidaceae bacterium]
MTTFPYPWDEIVWQKVIEKLTIYDPAEPMIFSSGIFLFLFLAFALIYFCLQKTSTLRLLFVTLFSYYFYYKSSGFYFFLLAVVTTSDYIIGRLIAKTESKTKAKTLVALSLLIDLGLLAYFKYTNFFAGMLAPLWTNNFQPYDIFLPVGISFFTFQSLSYTIDIYRKRIEPLKNLLDYAFYVSFFPQLVAGPIVRAADFIPQIRKPLVVTPRMFSDGVFLIVSGLFKKAIISDYISVNFVERVFDQPQMYSGLENLLAIYGYTLQIYCDFSGYSDMAIGIALLLGFRFPKNFDSPYKSSSVTEFWRRWHISLSSWLRDYLYISLGGNRKGKIRQYLNLIITMLLGGLWHGASVNFILWGGLHGVALALDKMKNTLLHRPKGYRSKGFTRFIGAIITFHFVVLSWVFFRNASFENAQLMLTTIVTNFQPQIFLQWATSYSGVAALMVIGYILHFLPSSLTDSLQRFMARTDIIFQALIIIIIIFIVIQVKSSDIQPFIYFQF